MGLLDYDLQLAKNKLASILGTDSVMDRPQQPEWQPEYQRIGGHALEAPMFSPDDLIGTGIPTKLAMLAKGAAVAAAPAATMGLLSTAAKQKGVTTAASKLAQVLDGEAGAILKKGNIPKNALYPEEFKASINRAAKFDQTENMDSAGNLWNTGQQAQIRQLNDGNYLLVSSPVWPNKGAGKYAVGDSLDELQQYAARQGVLREAAREGAESKTLLGKLKKEYGDDAFSTATSTQSNSQYITHIPSGTKIRISDHDLPLHYEQPDLDLRSGMSIQDQLKAIGILLK